MTWSFRAWMIRVQIKTERVMQEEAKVVIVSFVIRFKAMETPQGQQKHETKKRAK